MNKIDMIIRIEYYRLIRNNYQNIENKMFMNDGDYFYLNWMQIGRVKMNPCEVKSCLWITLKRLFGMQFLA